VLIPEIVLIADEIRDGEGEKINGENPIPLEVARIELIFRLNRSRQERMEEL
jgi:hypothetical protein